MLEVADQSAEGRTGRAQDLPAAVEFIKVNFDAFLPIAPQDRKQSDGIASHRYPKHRPERAGG